MQFNWRLRGWWCASCWCWKLNCRRKGWILLPGLMGSNLFPYHKYSKSDMQKARIHAIFMYVLWCTWWTINMTCPYNFPNMPQGEKLFMMKDLVFLILKATSMALTVTAQITNYLTVIWVQRAVMHQLVAQNMD